MSADFCIPCAGETPSMVTLNDAGQVAKACSICGTARPGSAMTASVVPGAINEGGRAVARPVAAPPPERAPVTSIASRRFAPRAPAGISPGDIIAEARAQLASLELEIPELEASIAGAKTHRRGLQKMVAAYERGAK